jgi:hypothetical protein
MGNQVNEGQPMNNSKFTRPPLNVALTAWKECLESQGLPAATLWIFAENLCIEPSVSTPGSFRFGYQTRFTPPDEDALEIAYDQFSETPARIVFYRLGSANQKSVCILLCDPWFEDKTARDGFIQRDEWKISLRPGHPGEIEEVTDLKRWVHRVRRDRAFHDFDFSMSLEAIDEIKMHGRPLMPYERMAQKMLGRLRRILGQQE